MLRTLMRAREIVASEPDKRNHYGCSTYFQARRCQSRMNPQIVRELTQLVSKINVATGILNSFDHNHAVDMFERLLIARIKFEPQEIHAGS